MHCAYDAVYVNYCEKIGEMGYFVVLKKRRSCAAGELPAAQLLLPIDEYTIGSARQPYVMN